MESKLQIYITLVLALAFTVAQAQYKGGHGRGDHMFGTSGQQIHPCANPVTGGEIAAHQTICYDTTPAAFTSVSEPNGYVGELEYRWQISTSSPTFVDIAGATNNTYTYTGALTQTTWFRRLARVTCESTWVESNVLQIEIDPLPTASAGGSATICENGSHQIPDGHATATHGTINWTTANGSGTIDNPGTLTPTYNAVADDAGTSVILTMTVTSDNACTPATATAVYTIHVDPLPSATAGGSATICENGAHQIPDGHATAVHGTINWTTANGSGTIDNPGTLTPTYNAVAGDAGTSVILTMTVTSDNACEPATATAVYTIHVDPLPTATAGGSTTICENGAHQIPDGHVTAAHGTINWTTANGSGTIDNQGTLTPTYNAVEGDAGTSVILNMTVTSNNECNPATATAVYTIHVDPLPTASAGGSATICENGSHQIPDGHVTAAHGTINWTTANGSGTIDNQGTLTPTYNAVAGDAGTSVILTLTVTSDNTCTTATATAVYTIHVDPLPTASAGGSATICENGAHQIPDGHATAAHGTINWTTANGSGTIDNPGTLTPTYNAVAGDAGKTVTLTITVTSDNFCGTATATAYYIISVEPIAITGQLQKHPDVDEIAMGAPVSATFSAGSGGNGTDKLQYRTHDGTNWSIWQDYTTGSEISSFLKTEIEIRTRRMADACNPDDYVTVSWNAGPVAVKNVTKNFRYYLIQNAFDAASIGDTIRIKTNIYPENINTSGKGLTLQPGFSQGIVTVTGTFTLSAGDVLEMELFDDGDYDKFIIEDNASINGASLNIKVVGNYKPAAGTNFTIFTSPNDPGRFTSPALIEANGHYFILSYEESAKNNGYSVVLTAVAPVFRMEIQQTGD